MGVSLVTRWLALATITFAGVLLSPGLSPAGVVWRDGFTQGLDTSKWYARGGCPSEQSAEGWLCYDPANAWTDGGFLHLRQTPLAVAGGATMYDGSMVSTYLHGRGWPSKTVYGSWAPPVKIEARIRYNGSDGFWQGFVAYSTDQDKVTELDIAEMRGQAERYMLCAVHYDHNAVKIHLGRKLPFNWTRGFHTWWLDYYRTWVRFGVDDLTCGTTPLPGDAGQIGISFDAKSGNFPWAGGAVLGSPEYVVDWVRVSQ